MINKSEIKNIYSKTKEKGYIIAQNLMYIYIILCPIFDMASYIYRNYIVKQESISVNPITLLRPIIPMIILAIIFFKVSLAEKIQIIFLGLLNILYIYIHSLIFIEYKTYFVFKLFFRRNTDKLKIAIAIMTGLYITSILFSIIFKISPNTYTEGIGQKGFFETGNSLSIILLLAVGLLLTTIKLKGRYMYIGITIITSIYLLFIMGSRTGFYRNIITYNNIYFSKYIFICYK